MRSTVCKGLFFPAWRKKSETWLGTSETLTGRATLERASEGKRPRAKRALVRARRDATALRAVSVKSRQIARQRRGRYRAADLWAFCSVGGDGGFPSWRGVLDLNLGLAGALVRISAPNRYPFPLRSGRCRQSARGRESER